MKKKGMVKPELSFLEKYQASLPNRHHADILYGQAFMAFYAKKAGT